MRRTGSGTVRIADSLQDVRLVCCAVCCTCLLALATQEANAQGEAWVARYDGPASDYDGASAVAVDDSGYIYVTGYSTGVGTSVDYATVKYNSDGDTVWVRRYDGPANSVDQAVCIAVDDSGHIYVTGWSIGAGTNYDYATIKYKSNGDTVWVRRYNGPAGMQMDMPRGLALDSSGNVHVTGWSFGVGTSFDYATVKYSSAGDTLWVRRYDGPANSADNPSDIAVDATGNVYVTGFTQDLGGTSGDYATVKYNSAGDTQWVRIYNGLADSTDWPCGLAVDASGSVYVTGYSYGVGTSGDIATIKYNTAGDSLWVNRYDGPGSGLDRGWDVAVDVSGNVYVVGESSGIATFADYITIKYSAAGDTLWVRRYNGPGDSTDVAGRVAVDGFGNVCVSGWSWGAGTLDDYATLKYKNNGDSIWVRSYNGPGDSADMGGNLALDAYGNVYVTGRSVGFGTGSDYATIKYCYVDAGAHTIPNPPGVVSVDSTYNPEAWVRNSGGCTATFDVVATIGTTYADTSQATDLAPWDSTLVTFSPWTVPPVDSALYTITVCTQLLDDGEPANDCVQKGILALSSYHDCGVVSLDSPGDTVFADSIYPVTAAVMNFGTYPETFDVVATIDGYADTVQVAGLAPDSLFQVSFTDWQVPSGDSVTYTMTVCTYVVDDADSTNDCAQKSIFAYIPVGVLEQDIRRAHASRFALGENQPNPFCRSTEISYSLPVASEVNLAIYDITGRLVEILVNEAQQPGIHEVRWNRKTNPSGIYFYSLKAREFVKTRKMVVID